MFGKIGVTEVLIVYFSIGMPLLVLFLSYFAIKLAIKNAIKNHKNTTFKVINYLCEKDALITVVRRKSKLIALCIFLFIVLAIVSSLVEALFAILAPIVILVIIYFVVYFSVLHALDELKDENILEL